jgi:hypothetical protein
MCLIFKNARGELLIARAESMDGARLHLARLGCARCGGRGIILGGRVSPGFQGPTVGGRAMRFCDCLATTVKPPLFDLECTLKRVWPGEE